MYSPPSFPQWLHLTHQTRNLILVQCVCIVPCHLSHICIYETTMTIKIQNCSITTKIFHKLSFFPLPSLTFLAKMYRLLLLLFVDPSGFLCFSYFSPVTPWVSWCFLEFHYDLCIMLKSAQLCVGGFF